ncbi:MAG: PH domain-containing protein [Nocardioides sp.]
MPAGSESGEPLVTLPHTFRPFGARIAVYALGGMLFAVGLAIWIAFPPEIRAKFTPFQIGTIVFLSLGFAALGWGIARSRVEAREEGMRVINGYRVRDYEWTEVLGITLRPGSPWAVLDLSDGTSASAIGIQGSDGPRAARQVRQLRALAEQHSRTDRND